MCFLTGPQYHNRLMGMKSILDNVEWKYNCDEEAVEAFYLPASVMRDCRLSCKSKVVWAYMNSRPAGWDFSSSRIAESLKEGFRAVQGAIRELEGFCYLKRNRLANGRVRYELIKDAPLLTEAEAIESLGVAFPSSVVDEDFVCTEEARRRLIEAGMGARAAHDSACGYTKSCNEGSLPMSEHTFRRWKDHAVA